jgi:hypothetical protein
MTTATQATRRPLHFLRLADVLADVEALGAVERRTLGRWTDSQIIEHLAISVDMAFDGYGFRGPWPIRAFVRLIKNRILTGPMPAGIRLPRRGAAMLPAGDVAWDEAVRHLGRAIARFDTEVPSHPHPVLGGLTTMEYELLTLRHAELHLSFIVPAAG